MRQIEFRYEPASVAQRAEQNVAAHASRKAHVVPGGASDAIKLPSIIALHASRYDAKALQ
jgi:hypothetical protein